MVTILKSTSLINTTAGTKTLNVSTTINASDQIRFRLYAFKPPRRVSETPAANLDIKHLR